LAINGANRVSKRRIVMGRSAEKEGSGADKSSGGKNREDSSKWPKLWVKRQTVWLPNAHGKCNPPII
jgi:hypothetical protein